PGSITGSVLVNGSGQAGVVVTVSQGGTSVGTGTTVAPGGTYTVASLPPGSYTASINAPSSTSCTSTTQTVTVQANQASTANFVCTSLPGTISGSVFVDLVGRVGVAVTLTQGGTTVASTTTGAGGAYSFASLAAGFYSVSITAPANTTCPNNPRAVDVQSNQTTTANFTCAANPNEFLVTLDNPSPSYRHIVAGVSSETCTGMSTSPAQPGGSWTTMWTGTGTVGATTRTGVLDASGRAVDRQAINQFGTYNVNASVTAGGTTRSTTGSVTVTAAAGACPP
ncbi:MAG TPA: carboxypeptidase regulatory-like domain-containing protein, partial [Gemmatimonadaceae bacterium]|nr:carboxypeptidase regulatory-like domain-containing protein [Gemmatimonadaceae bacterium]